MVRIKNQMAPVLDTENTESIGESTNDPEHPEPTAKQSDAAHDEQSDRDNLHSFQEPEIEIKEEYFTDEEQAVPDVPKEDDVPKKKPCGRPRKNKNAEVVAVVHDYGSRSRSERTKKAKSIFDPSIDKDRIKRRRFPNPVEMKQLPKLDKPRPIATNKSPLGKYPRKISLDKCCYVCLKPEGTLDQVCRTCGTLAHSKCLERQQNGYVVRILGADWKCPACLLCFVCKENVNYGHLVVCNTCKHAYHADCHFPVLRNVINPESWMCAACTSDFYCDDEGSSNELDTNALMQTMNTQPAPESPAINQAAIEKLRKWDTDDVYEYFYLYFPELASVFKEQEIDGSTILLMKRVDVLKGFKHLKLGPALNIYRHIVKLQNGGNEDPRLCWH